MKFIYSALIIIIIVVFSFWFINKNDKENFICQTSQDCEDIGWECENGYVPLCQTYVYPMQKVENPKCTCTKPGQDWF